MAKIHPRVRNKTGWERGEVGGGAPEEGGRCGVPAKHTAKLEASVSPQKQAERSAGQR